MDDEQRTITMWIAPDVPPPLPEKFDAVVIAASPDAYVRGIVSSVVDKGDGSFEMSVLLDPTEGGE